MATLCFTCRHCGRALVRQLLRSSPTRPYSDKRRPPSSASPETKAEPGALSRRLEEATEETLLEGGRAGQRAVEEAGFSAELKERLLSKLADAQFRAEHAGTLSAAGLDARTMLPAAGAAAVPEGGGAWTGDEPLAAGVRRMLEDAHKPLPRELRARPVVPQPVVVGMRPRRAAAVSVGRRAAEARERASAYAGLGLGRARPGDPGLTEAEREALRGEFRERFAPGARALANTISGLAGLANERIEEAMARGQFRHIRRGPGVERDARVDNPFVDTTEYIMNNMIKRQDVVPPWIDKQQELARAARVFRTRLRSDWKRHAARVIASRGGSLQHQMARAAAFAAAEEATNPRPRNVEEMVVPASATHHPVMASSSLPGPPPTRADAPHPGARQTRPPPPSPLGTRPGRRPSGAISRWPWPGSTR